jgi:hypothetical protein
MSNVLQTACADSIGTLLIFLHLLEREPKGIAKCGLSHPEHLPAHTHATAHMLVNRTWESRHLATYSLAASVVFGTLPERRHSSNPEPGVAPLPPRAAPAATYRSAMALQCLACPAAFAEAPGSDSIGSSLVNESTLLDSDRWEPSKTPISHPPMSEPNGRWRR